MRAHEGSPRIRVVAHEYRTLSRCLSVLASSLVMIIAVEVHGAGSPVQMAMALSGVECSAFDVPLGSAHSAAAANGEELLDAVSGYADVSDAVDAYLAAGGAPPEPLLLHRESHAHLTRVEWAPGGDFAEAIARIYGRLIGHGSSTTLDGLVSEIIVPDLRALGGGGNSQRCAVGIATVGQQLFERVAAIAPDAAEIDRAVAGYREAVGLIMGQGSRCVRNDRALALGQFSSVIPELLGETDAVNRAALETAADMVLDDLKAFDRYPQKNAASALALLGKSLIQTFARVPGADTEPLKSAIFDAYADRRAELMGLSRHRSGDRGTALGVLGGAAVEGIARNPDVEAIIREVVGMIVGDIKTLARLRSSDFAIGLGIMGHEALTGVARQPEATTKIKAMVNSITVAFAGFPDGEQTGVGWSIGCAAGAGAEGIARQPQANASIRSTYNLVVSKIMARKLPRKVDDTAQGFALLGMKAIEGIARQPEAERAIRRLMELAAEDLRVLPRDYQKRAAIAVGSIASAFAAGTARQPEVFGKMQSAYERLMDDIFALKLNRRNDDVAQGIGIGGAALIAAGARNPGALPKLEVLTAAALGDLNRLDGRSGFWRFGAAQKNLALAVATTGAAWLEAAPGNPGVGALELLYQGIVDEISRRRRSFFSFAGVSPDLSEALGIVGRTSIRTSAEWFGDDAAHAELFRIIGAIRDDIGGLSFD